MIFLYIQNIATSYDAKKMNEVCCVNWPKIQKVTYGSVNDCSRTRFLRISDNENENFIGKSRKEFLAPLTRTDDP